MNAMAMALALVLRKKTSKPTVKVEATVRSVISWPFVGFWTTLSYGSEGESVKILQQNLIALGFDCGSYGADGDFGGATQAAVTAFQEAHKLPATGIANEATLKKIAELLDLEGDNENNEQISVPVPNGITVNKGSWNVRTGPGVEYSCAGVVRGGDILEKVDIGDWIPVMYNGELRFISPKAVKN